MDSASESLQEPICATKPKEDHRTSCSEWQFVSPFYLILHFSECLLSVNAKTDPEISAQSCQSPHICKGYLPRSQELDEGFG